MSFLRTITFFIFSFISCVIFAQPPQGINWAKDGNSFYQSTDDGIEQVNLAASKIDVILTKEALTPPGAPVPLKVRNFFFSNDGEKVLIYTNSKRVWRYDTRDRKSVV